MLRLTLNPEKNGSTLTFDKPVIVIGSGLLQGADVLLDEENLENEHLKIINQEGEWVICNVANDPFVTLNGLPFGKKKLQHHDTLQIGDTTIVFDLEPAQAPLSEEWYDTVEKLPKIIEEAIVSKTAAPEATVSPQHEEAPYLDLEAMMNEVEKLDREEEQVVEETPKPPLDPQPEAKHKPKPAHKEYYLSEFDDENEGFIKEQEEPETYSSLEPQRNWRLLVFIVVAFLTITTTILTGVYLSLSGRSEKEELTAAEGVADVAMALTYAQLHHINPHKQNWSDPDFLRNNLNAVLTANYPTLATIDSLGQFSNCPYILRIYTSRDLSQFLVIAQPAPSLMHWLIPKMTIVADSKSMELRKLKDIKGLNRLLVNANTLDGTNAMDVSQIVKQGDLIPLSALTSKKGNLGFTTPTALALLRPGAENRIYNAARYYFFGENILNKALALSETPATSHDVTLFKQYSEPFSKLNDIVLYSSLGMQSAMQAQKALSTFAPEDKFLIAYLVFNSKGMISGSHLLIDDDNSQVAIVNRQPVNKEENDEAKVFKTFAYALESLHNPKAVPPTPSGALGEEAVPAYGAMGGHPLSLQLTHLISARQHALKPISDQIESLLSKENRSLVDDFHEQLTQLLAHYESVDKIEQDKIGEGITELLKEHNTMPLAMFMEYLEAAGLTPLFQQRVTAQQQTQTKFQRALTELEITAQIDKIAEAENLQQLSQAVRSANQAMLQQNLSEPEKLIAHQSEVRNKVESMLSRFLMSQEHKLPQNSLSEAGRGLLVEILNQSWIADPEEHEYYLNEFDILVGKS